MKVTPLDLRQQRFQTVMRGYDRSEVQTFLLEVADDYENALRENDRLRQDISPAREDAHRASRPGAQSAAHAAHRAAAGRRNQGARQSGSGAHPREAEGRADVLLQRSNARLEDVQREIDGLRMKRREVETRSSRW